MPLPPLPLAPYRAFSAASVEFLESVIASKLAAVCVAAPTERPISAFGNRYQLPFGELWFCSYGERVQIRFAESDYIRVQFHHAGAGATQIDQRQYSIHPRSGCISSAAALLTFGKGFQQLVWRVSRAALSSKLSALTGAPAPRTLEFEPELDMSRSRPLLGILRSAVDHITTSAPNRFLLAELEQAMMVSLLVHAEHDGRRLMMAETGRAAPSQVRRVEEHIVAHLDSPFDIEEAVRITGCSARSIYRAFQKHRGYSPAAFSKHRRLLRARDLLRTAPWDLTVTQVAESCGFGDFSHFSRDYVREFGESPSATRR